MRDTRVRPPFPALEILVVDNSPDSGIEAGNRLGARMVQILRAGVPGDSNATHYIHSLSELQEFMMRAPLVSVKRSA
jgi:hypothetical protein